MDIKNIIFNALKKYTNKNLEESSNIKELNIDSLDLLQLVVELEKTFKISISDEQLLQIKTVKDIIEIINSKESEK